MADWLNSVYSDTTKNYVSNPCPKVNENVVISLQMRKNSEIRKVILRYREFGFERLCLMEKKEEELLFWYEAKVKVQEKRFQYQFYLVTEDKIYYYTQFRITDYIPDESRDFVILADYKMVSWINNAVFYQILPDRFCNGNPSITVKDGEYSYQGHKVYNVKDWDTPAKCYCETGGVDFYGGDLEGIYQKLDYLQELGINAIYLNPIFLSPSIHKYDSLDYTMIDPHLGGEDALIKLVQAMHERGMKLMMDISINHTSSDALWFNKSGEFYNQSIGAYHNPDSKERTFFFFEEDGTYDTWCGVKTMPKLNYASQDVRDNIYRKEDSVLKKWILPPYNIDGWRFDVAECIARNQIINVRDEVLEEMRQELKKVKEDVFLLAEDWADCSEDLQGNKWDSTMNYYSCARPIREFVGERDLFLERNSHLKKIQSKMTASQFANRIRQFYGKLPGVIQYQMFNLIDSHDVIRLHNSTKVSAADYETAVTLMFTLPGAVCIYYGDEVALMGGVEDVDLCRYPMDWNWESNKEAVSRYNFYKTLISFKRKVKALADGGFRIISEEGYVVSYARFTKDELVIVIASTDDVRTHVNIPLSDFGFESEMMIERDLFGKEILSEKITDGIKVQIPPHTSYVIYIKK